MNLTTFFDVLLSKYGHFIPDKLYLKLKFRLREGYWMDFENPHTLNEKLQWLKLHNRQDKYTLYSDKYEVKKYIREVLGEGYVIPTIGIWDNPEEIDFSKLPEKFVLKPTHNSSVGRCICTDKSKLDIRKAISVLKKALAQNYYYVWREWPYKNIKPRIIGEEFVQNADGSPIVDYKFYCFGGSPQYFMYSVGEAHHCVRNCKFDMKGNNIDYLFKKQRTLSDDEISLPKNLDEMVAIVEKLCVGYPHIRIDLYNVDGHIYFGEMTFYTGDGFINIENNEFSQKLADLIDITPYK